jgi:uncharacterized protein YidB (DUF937 family)
MTPGLPSLTALLSLLAVSGVQNRDRLARLLGQAIHPPANDNEAAPDLSNSNEPDEMDDLLDSLNQGSAGGLGGLLGGTSVGDALSGALGSLMEHFEQNGLGKTARSWVSSGANEPIGEGQLEQALGQDLLEELTRSTGLTKEDILARLSSDLPKAVDELTPAGTLPVLDNSSPQEPS